MKTISISNAAHKKIENELKESKKNNTLPKPTYGSIVEEMTTKRYKNKSK